MSLGKRHEVKLDIKQFMQLIIGDKKVGSVEPH